MGKKLVLLLVFIVILELVIAKGGGGGRGGGGRSSGGRARTIRTFNSRPTLLSDKQLRTTATARNGRDSIVYDVDFRNRGYFYSYYYVHGSDLDIDPPLFPFIFIITTLAVVTELGEVPKRRTFFLTIAFHQTIY
eukprot:TRINITY_DN604_c0_g1_i1.p2 TRINITY_DN604_c0_g1~~TRINITY_DN604_c0_g1_i1.p2  ORF type:complete len:151 (+),score=28.70 TRINITY_DN604_c0_g1_i1:51-455(+)